MRPVLLQHPHVREPAVHAVGEREVDQAVRAGEGERGLRALLRERAEAGALPAGEDEDEGAGAARHVDGAGQGACRAPAAVAW